MALKDLYSSLRLAHKEDDHKENLCLSPQIYAGFDTLPRELYFTHCILHECKQPGCAAAGIAPYMALELGVFDLMPKDLSPFVRGFSSAFMATTLCYPLDTVRYASRVLNSSSCLRPS